jgi:hypothetical protein
MVEENSGVLMLERLFQLEKAENSRGRYKSHWAISVGSDSNSLNENQKECDIENKVMRRRF